MGAANGKNHIVVQADSDVLQERRGVCVFTHGLVDKAAQMVEAMTDDQIRGSDGVKNMIKFFDDHHAPHQKISDHEYFEHAVYGYERSSVETYLAYVIKKRESVQRCEQALIGDRLMLHKEWSSNSLCCRNSRVACVVWYPHRNQRGAGSASSACTNASLRTIINHREAPSTSRSSCSSSLWIR